jgi:hypothetical protein
MGQPSPRFHHARHVDHMLCDASQGGPAPLASIFTPGGGDHVIGGAFYTDEILLFALDV